MKTFSDDRRLNVINSLPWVHSIELPGGIVTPGRWGPPNKAILSLFDSIDFNGKSVLDIGCWDGLWSFESEKRGATTIFAMDDVSQRPYHDQPCFTLAHDLLKSKVIYRPHISVYDIDNLEKRDFDIILFFGIHNHLKHPLYAFSKLRRVCKDGGLLLTEGPAFRSRKRSYAKFYYNQWFQGRESDWWVPSIRCLREMIECSFFRVSREIDTTKLEYCYPGKLLYRIVENIARIALDQPFPKHYIIQAVAVSGNDHNYCYPDANLKEFDKNQYDEIPSTAESTTRKSLTNRLVSWWLSQAR